MTKQTNLQIFKLFIKSAIIITVLGIFIALGVFIRTPHTFENSHMKKWLALSEFQRIETVENIIKDDTNQELLIKCVTKIANLPHSNEMLIRDAAFICYKGIQINSAKNEE